MPKDEADTPLIREIDAYLARTGESPRSLSLKIGDNPTLIRQIRSGRSRNPRGDTLTKLSEVMKVPLQKLTGSTSADGGAPLHRFAEGSDVQPILTRQPMEARRLPLGAQAPVMGVVSCGSDGQFEINLSSDPLEYVDLPPKLVAVPGIYALFVAGESMDGIWSPGDVVYVAKNRPVTPGAYVVVLVNEERGHPPGAYLKQYVRGDNEWVVLSQTNPSMEREIHRSLVKEMHRALHWREWAL